VTAIPFILAATADGPLIVSHLDHNTGPTGYTYGVGHQLLDAGTFDAGERDLGIRILQARRQNHGDGVVCIDGGANIGAFTVPWAKAMTGWGTVLAVEAQERLFYALCGNIALNNLFNAYAHHAALHRFDGAVTMQMPDYQRPGSYGSLNLCAPQVDLGQDVERSEDIQAGMIDTLALPRLDFLKLDVEGMEVDALAGAHDTIRRCKPIILAEQIKSNVGTMKGLLETAVHRDDPTLADLRVVK
jgi:FkbM family methyltransferase